MNIHHGKNASKILFIILINLTRFQNGFCQGILNRRISIDAENRPLELVLKMIQEKGDFHFSYNGLILSKDSIVTISAADMPIGNILDKLLTKKYECAESSNFVIINLAQKKLALISPDITSSERSFTISGIIVDAMTGKRLANVSVLERQQLAYEQTDEHGYFKLKFKNSTDKKIIIDLTLSKNNYSDTTIHFLETISIRRDVADDYSHTPDNYASVENTTLGSLFISAKRKIQNLNLRHFLVDRRFQISLAPGLSSRGKLSPQISNNLSLNVTGGYTGGVSGLELAGLYNINKNNVNFLQLAGVFNLVGGSVNGLQLAGIHNMALGNVNGVQVSGSINRSEAVVNGIQISSLVNYAQSLHGLQIGLINVADSSNGLSIGLINIIRNGNYQVSVFSNDLINTGIAFKSGNHKFYSTILLGANLSQNHKLYSFGLGLGRDFKLFKIISLTTQADYSFVNSGLWDDRWFRIKSTVNFELSKTISVFAGPTWNRYNQSGEAAPGYQNVAKKTGELSPNGHYISKWLGWEAGLAFSSKFKGAKKEDNFRQKSYNLGVAVSAGIGWDEPYGLVSGAEVFLTKKVGKSFSGVVTTGYTHFSIQPQYRQSESSMDAGYTAKPITVIPLKAGIRMYITPRFYVGGETGVGLNIGSQKNTTAYGTYSTNRIHFTYSPFMGLNIFKGLDVSFKFEDYIKNNDAKQFAIKTSYQLSLSK